MTERDNLVARPDAGTHGRRPQRRRPIGKLIRDRRIGPTALVAAGALVGLVIWLVIDSQSNGSNNGGTAPVALSASGLKAFAKKAQQPIYWVGSRKNAKYEVTQNSRG